MRHKSALRGYYGIFRQAWDMVLICYQVACKGLCQSITCSNFNSGETVDVFGNHGLGGLLEEGAHEKFPK